MKAIVLFTLISASLMSFCASAEIYCPQHIQCSYLTGKCVADGPLDNFTQPGGNFSDREYHFWRAYSTLDNSQQVSCLYLTNYNNAPMLGIEGIGLKAKLSASGTNAWSRASENEYFCQSDSINCPFVKR